MVERSDGVWVGVVMLEDKGEVVVGDGMGGVGGWGGDSFEIREGLVDWESWRKERRKDGY